MGLSVAWALLVILLAVVLCQPVGANWDPSVHKTCGNQNMAYVSAAVIDIATDLMLIALPLKPLIALRIKTLHKAALSLIFCAGFIIIQPGIAIMVACSPLLKPIADRALGSRPCARYDGSGGTLSRNLGIKLRALVKSDKRGTVDSSRSISVTLEQPSDVEHGARSGLWNTGTYQATVQAQENSYSDGDVSGGAACDNGRITVTRQAIVTSSR
ncbi:hypothetical protein F5Y00DRAFT_257885 [Daldinia vernicosa]|uniref:uncharacterized protein n=1 Tax=Daldinia vernicosa TaxID=114800 RepID=UPI002008A420|nr:uncharacterized protein F5Y00DRAFT_257885 [Daldinia vernicosa]KAI0853226.1 hypothetical protein F5Y00DRAFT_257885 [Daldinia vernicosa]